MHERVSGIALRTGRREIFLTRLNLRPPASLVLLEEVALCQDVLIAARHVLHGVVS